MLCYSATALSVLEKEVVIQVPLGGESWRKTEIRNGSQSALAFVLRQPRHTGGFQRLADQSSIQSSSRLEGNASGAVSFYNKAFSYRNRPKHQGRTGHKAAAAT